MSDIFVLDVETHPAENRAVFRLSDGHGVFLAANEVRLSGQDASSWEGLFDMRAHVERYAIDNDFQADSLKAEKLIERLGVFLSDNVLGKEIFGKLHEGVQVRTLLVRMPDTGADHLAGAFARVPWEIACSESGQTLYQRNVAVRAVTASDLLQSVNIPNIEEIRVASESDEHLRVLLIFSEAPDSNPLAMRLERERLLDLFYDDIMPEHQVRVDVLCHGITRAVIEEQVRKAKGYHIVHWSGHGHHDTLEITGDDGKAAKISGAELIDLFTKACGFIPKLVFLSACHSGSLNQAQHAPNIAQSVAEKKGYTGTALAFLSLGVSQVIAMRYAVGDAYARRLARRFYRHLIAESHHADIALSLARQELAHDKRCFENAPADHATPLLFGKNRLMFAAHEKRSSQLKERYPEPRQPLLEGDLKRPFGFVGRSRELTQMKQEWLPRKKTPLAVIQGLAGMGKTLLAAEAIHLWHDRFDYVLAFQSRQYAISAEEFYRDSDARLAMASKVYREKCRENEYRKIFLPKEELNGAQRYEAMRNNLTDALHDERILLVLDNFETHLFQDNSCKDPEWKNLLNDFGIRLNDSGSRVLLTTRHLPADLKDRALWIALGPLPLNEARLLFQHHDDLRNLWHNKETRSVAMRVLTISRGHPLILQRLGNLAKDADKLKDTMDRLEEKGFQELPELVISAKTEKERETERKYLDDVVIGVVDVLIERMKADARRLLWVITRASEPVPAKILEDVWKSVSIKKELRECQEMIDIVMGQLESVSDNRFAKGNIATSFGVLLSELIESGLVQKEGADTKVVYGFHELVRERCAAWMNKYHDEQGKLDEKHILEVYGEKYVSIFEKLQSAGLPKAREAATEMGRRGLVYFVRAGVFDKLGSFASYLVTGTLNPQQLQAMIAELQGIMEQVPEGPTRWRIRAILADAIWRSGHPKQSLAFYEQAAKEAEATQNRSDVGVIYHNWANALKDTGRLSQAREMFMHSADAERKADRHGIDVIAAELEAFRIDVIQGRATETLSEIEQHLNKIRDWYQRHVKGETIDEAPYAEILARAFISAMDIAHHAHSALKNWQECLKLLKEIETVIQRRGESEYEIARIRINQYEPLIKLNRLDEARSALEWCLQKFRDVNDPTMQSIALSVLADLWERRGDLSRSIELERQALSVKERLDDPEHIAISYTNMSNYLFNAGEIEESASHGLAGFVYFIITNNQQYIEATLSNIAIHLRQNPQYRLPRLSPLLSLPEFGALKRFLENWQVNIEDLQRKIDALIV